MKKQLFFGHVLTLIIGGLIYILFRTDSLVMFKWFAALSLDKPIEYLRDSTLTVKNHLPDWFLFSLPDGLWIFSYITFELGQLFNIVPGTFDAIDLIFYIAGAVFPLVFFKNNLLITKTKTT